MTKISSSSFYSEYHGHKLRHLEALYPLLRAESDALLWTAGDSSLDNKYWINHAAPAVGVYADVLSPPRSVADVVHWLNYLSAVRYDDENRKGANTIGGSGGGNDYVDGGKGRRDSRARKYLAINAAVEATTLNERTLRLRSQDAFLRDNISPGDVLIVSVGGNDIALCPAPCTVASMAGLLCLPSACLSRGRSFGSVPVDDYCCGCGPSLASCACSCPPFLGYFRHLFGTRTQKYIEALTSKTRPRKILVCMIYYPDEINVPSWANAALGALGYNRKPARLQLLIRKIFEEATSTIRIPGSQVIPVPLFVALDGTRSEDYVARVEPSAIGGRKMAEFLLHAIHSELSHEAMIGMTSSTPTASFIVDR